MPGETPAPSPIGVLLTLWLLIGCLILPLFRWIKRRRRQAPRSAAAVEIRSPAPVRSYPEVTERGCGVVLVADDERLIVRFVEINLQRVGYAAITTTDWEEVLPMARAARPDVMVLDVFMAWREDRGVQREPTGCELIRAARADPLLAEIPILLMASRSADARNPLPCKELLADDVRCIFKPFNPPELLSLVGELIRARNSRS
jgi:CheY-like chemotaxis protein